MNEPETSDARASAIDEPRYHHGDLPAALLRAAEAELAEGGIERFSLRAVAKRAGVSHAAPAHHFGDVNGLLSALAEQGFRRFLEVQLARQRKAAPEPLAQLLASGLGYIDFAIANPALFRLMFASERPRFTETGLCAAADAAFDQLVKDVAGVIGFDPRGDADAMSDVMACWAVTHGLADLMIARRAAFLTDLPPEYRDDVLSEIIARAIMTGRPDGGTWTPIRRRRQPGA